MRIRLGQYRSALMSFLVAFATLPGAPACVSAQTDVETLRRALKFQTHRLKKMTQAKKPQGAVVMVHDGGTQDDADKYYARIAPLIKFPDLPQSDLASFLVYLGFEGLAPADLELLDSRLLMPATQSDFDLLANKVSDSATFKSKRVLQDFAPDKMLVSRFFAPKIVNFNDPPNRDSKQNPYKAGWRKLVRIEPRAGSAADQGNIREAYILMNYFQADVEKYPFPQKPEELNELDPTKRIESVNNQIILIPKKFEAQKEDSAYWLVYQPKSLGYKLGHFLTAAFDDPKQGDPTTKPYFVPTACAQCHGHDNISEADPPSLGPFPNAKVNYLDTDQWYDMLDFDFPGTKKATLDADVIFDGNRDHNTTTYADAVSVLLKLNRKIKVQNEESLRPNKPDQYKVDAVDKWIKLHEADPKPAGLFQRVIGAAPQWDAGKPLDAQLLPRLSQYCFRCHSTIRFDVFNRRAMKGKSDTAGLYVSNDSMPEGRTLADGERATLVNLLSQLCSEAPACDEF